MVGHMSGRRTRRRRRCAPLLGVVLAFDVVPGVLLCGGAAPYISVTRHVPSPFPASSGGAATSTPAATLATAGSTPALTVDSARINSQMSASSAPSTSTIDVWASTEATTTAFRPGASATTSAITSQAQGEAGVQQPMPHQPLRGLPPVPTRPRTTATARRVIALPQPAGAAASPLMFLGGAAATSSYSLPHSDTTSAPPSDNHRRTWTTTKDSAPAASRKQLKNNEAPAAPVRRTCDFCLVEEDELEKGAGRSCGHYSCFDCLLRMAEISVREQKPLWCPLCLASSPSSSSPTRGRQLEPRREPLLKMRDRADPAARVNAANDRFFRLPVSLQDGLVALELKQVRESNRRQYTPCPRRHCRGSIELPADEFRLLPDDGISDLEPEDEQDAEFGFASSSERKEVEKEMLKRRVDDRDHGRSTARSSATNSTATPGRGLGLVTDNRSASPASSSSSSRSGSSSRSSSPGRRSPRQPVQCRLFPFSFLQSSWDRMWGGRGASSHNSRDSRTAEVRVGNSGRGVLYEPVAMEVEQPDGREDGGTTAQHLLARRGQQAKAKLAKPPPRGRRNNRRAVWCGYCSYSFCARCMNLSHVGASTRNLRLLPYRTVLSHTDGKETAENKEEAPHDRPSTSSARRGSSAFSQSTFCEDCCSGSSVLFTYACDPFLCKYVSVKLPDLGVYAKLHDPEKNAEVVQALMEQLEEGSSSSSDDDSSQEVDEEEDLVVDGRTGRTTADEIVVSGGSWSRGAGCGTRSSCSCSRESRKMKKKRTSGGEREDAGVGTSATSRGSAAVPGTAGAPAGAHPDAASVQLVGPRQDSRRMEDALLGIYNEHDEQEQDELLADNSHLYSTQDEEFAADLEDCAAYVRLEREWRRWVASLRATAEDLTSQVSQWRQDEAHKERNCRLCPHCGSIVEKTDGCDNVRCGENWYRKRHGGRNKQHGCGKEFKWSQATPYKRQQHGLFGTSSSSAKNDNGAPPAPGTTGTHDSEIPEEILQLTRTNVFQSLLSPDRYNPDLEHFCAPKAALEKSEWRGRRGPDRSNGRAEIPAEYRIHCRLCQQPLKGPLFHCVNFPRFTQMCCFSCVKDLVAPQTPGGGSGGAGAGPHPDHQQEDPSLDPTQPILRRDHVFEVFFEEFGAVLFREVRSFRARKLQERLQKKNMPYHCWTPAYHCGRHLLCCPLLECCGCPLGCMQILVAPDADGGGRGAGSAGGRARGQGTVKKKKKKRSCWLTKQKCVPCGAAFPPPIGPL